MSVPDWILLHGGALGDLALAIRFALALPDMSRLNRLRVISRTDPGDLSDVRPAILRRSSETVPIHRLFQLSPDGSSRRSTELVATFEGQRVLSFLTGPDTAVHSNLLDHGASAVFSVDPAAREGKRAHICEQWRQQVEAQALLMPECARTPRKPSLRPSANLVDRGAQRLVEAGVTVPAVVIHPGSGGARKCWPLPAFVEVAQILRERGLIPAFVLGPVELELWTQHQIGDLARVDRVLRIESPAELTEIAAGAAAMVANDSGPAHLAALLGRPVVSIFGPTDSAIWRPLSPGGVVFQGSPDHPDGRWGVVAPEVASAAAAIVGGAPRRDSAGSDPT